MKTGLITLPLLFVAGLAMANDIDREMADGYGHAATAPHRMHAHRHAVHHSPRHLPHGDMRHCLDQKSRVAIIRCSEMQHKKHKR